MPELVNFLGKTIIPVQNEFGEISWYASIPKSSYNEDEGKADLTQAIKRTKEEYDLEQEELNAI